MFDGRHKGALNNLGVIALDAKKYPQAESWFRRADGVDPRNAKTHFLLAKTLLAKDDAPGAKTEIETAIRLEPSQPEFLSLRDQISKPSNDRR